MHDRTESLQVSHVYFFYRGISVKMRWKHLILMTWPEICLYFDNCNCFIYLSICFYYRIVLSSWQKIHKKAISICSIWIGSDENGGVELV